MAFFKNKLRKYFGSTVANSSLQDTRVCVMGSNGNTFGSVPLKTFVAYITAGDNFVDMGLPSGTLWAKSNLGADTDTEDGLYFSWGNVDGHIPGDSQNPYSFDQNTYNTTTGASLLTDIPLSQDAARTILGGLWRMPTITELRELFNTDYTTQQLYHKQIGSDPEYSTYGVLLTSRINGNTLFFPFCGFVEEFTKEAGGEVCFIPTSTFDSTTNAYGFTIADDSGLLVVDGSHRRFLGLNIRPVI